MNHEELSAEAVTFFLKIKKVITITFKKNVPVGKQIKFHFSIPLSGESFLVGMAEDGSMIVDSDENLNDIPIFIDPLMAVLKQLEDKSYDIF